MARKSRKGCPVAACAYCGETADTRDHVVPKCLFLAPLPNNMVKVPSCLRCNRRKGRDDDFLRDVLVSDVYGAQHPQARAILKGALSRSVARGSSQLLAQFLRGDFEHIRMVSPSGLHLGMSVRVTLPPGRLDRTLFEIARGMRFHIDGMRLESSQPFVVRSCSPQEGDRLVVGEFKDSRYGSIGEVFEAWYFGDKTTEQSTLWLFRFYGWIQFTIATGNALPKGFTAGNEALTAEVSGA